MLKLQWFQIDTIHFIIWKFSIEELLVLLIRICTQTYSIDAYKNNLVQFPVFLANTVLYIVVRAYVY